MCMFSQPSMPSIPPPAAPTPAPQLPDSGVQQAASDQKSKAAAAMGAGQTILTGPQGDLTKTDTTNKTLLGG